MTKPFRLRPFLDDLEPYTPGEQLDGPEIVKLNTNENPYPPAPAVVDALGKAGARLSLYPDPTAEPLRRALADYHGLEPDQILVGNGSDEVLRILIQACIGRGERIAVADPTYSLYPVLSAQFEGLTRSYPLIEREKLAEDFFRGDEPLLLLPNPNPPLGTLYAHDEIAKLCRARSGRLVVIDEAYVDFAPRDAVPLLEKFANLAITRTFSKSFSMAGMRVGYVMGRAGLIAELMKIKDSYNLSHPAQAAAIAAIGAADVMRENSARILDTRARTARRLEELGYRVPDSHGNFLFAIHPDAPVHYEKLREGGILVRHFDAANLRDGIRITIGTPGQMDLLLDALEKISREFREDKGL